MESESVIRARGNRQSNRWLFLAHFNGWGWGGSFVYSLTTCPKATVLCDALYETPSPAGSSLNSEIYTAQTYYVKRLERLLASIIPDDIGSDEVFAYD